MKKQLFRNKQKASIGGVCAGLADYFDVDTTLVRALFLVALIGFGSGFLLYIILWIVIPEQINYVNNAEQTDYTIKDESTGNFTEAKVDHKRKRRNDSVIGGLVLVTLGMIFLADEFIPWFDFHKLWPMILVAVGAGIIWNNTQRNKIN